MPVFVSSVLPPIVLPYVVLFVFYGEGVFDGVHLSQHLVPPFVLVELAVRFFVGYPGGGVGGVAHLRGRVLVHRSFSVDVGRICVAREEVSYNENMHLCSIGKRTSVLYWKSHDMCNEAHSICVYVTKQISVSHRKTDVV